MKPDPIEHAVYRIRNARVRRYPFPHFFVKDVFPLDFFNWLRAQFNLEEEAVIKSDNALRSYIGRSVPALQDERLAVAITSLFGREIKALNLPANQPLAIMARLVRDLEGYTLWPHTDDDLKMLSALFYMDEGEGTSIYAPKEQGLKSTGREKFDPLEFNLIYTAPRQPNSVFGFIKSDNSWHGVEPSGPQTRDSVLYTITRPLSDEESRKLAEGAVYNAKY